MGQMIRCPECGAPTGGETGTDTYKHVVQCMHLPNEGVERLLAAHEGKDDERSRRVRDVFTRIRAEG